MSKPQDTIQRWLREKLHAHFDEVSHEPLPERWVDLIRYLEQEWKRSEDHRSQREPSSRRRA